MLPDSCGLLLYNAVRETLETMAFAEVVVCSISVCGREISEEPGFQSSIIVRSPADDGWGESTVSSPSDTWGTASEISEEAAWGSASPNNAPLPQGDSWGEPPPINDGDEEPEWGKSGIILPSHDPWGESSAVLERPEDLIAGMVPKAADFEELVQNQTDWIWSCMKVNSPDIQSVYFIVTKGLADALAKNMYASEAFDIDSPLIRDLIAELTNVLGGKLMLLLEERGGKFTLTVPEIGLGTPDLPSEDSKNAYCKVIVDREFPVIAALCG